MAMGMLMNKQNGQQGGYNNNQQGSGLGGLASSLLGGGNQSGNMGNQQGGLTGQISSLLGGGSNKPPYGQNNQQQQQYGQGQNQQQHGVGGFLGSLIGGHIGQVSLAISQR